MLEPATTLSPGVYAALEQRLAPLDDERHKAYPGMGSSRQPIHTVYVPADLYHPELPQWWGAEARRLLAEHAPDAAALAAVLELTPEVADDLYPRLVAKLRTEPVEDLRIDFEDGFGERGEDEEDRIAVGAAIALAQALHASNSPPSIGLRIKSLEAASRARALRTLDLFLTELKVSAELPQGLVITLPKVTAVEQVAAFAEVCAAWEVAAEVGERTLRFEIQIETPQAILGPDGTATVARMLHAAPGRVLGLHYGTYDYSAATGVSAGQQSLEHPVADYAKAVMQVAAAGTGVHLSDGSTNVLPVGDHDAVVAAWRLHARLVTRSLNRAFYQGWDLHSGHLVTRYAATYAFYRAGFPGAADRLRAYLDRSTGGLLDEPATAQAMASLLVRGLRCGALEAAEISERAGVDQDQLEALFTRRVG